MGLNLGTLVHDVTIQELTMTVTPSNQPKESWSTLCQAWMARDSMTGAERILAAQESAKAITRWVMRYRSDMDPDLVNVPKERRLLYNDRPYNIRAAENLDRKVGISLTTLAKVG